MKYVPTLEEATLEQLVGEIQARLDVFVIAGLSYTNGEPRQMRCCHGSPLITETLASHLYDHLSELNHGFMFGDQLDDSGDQ